MSLRDEIAFVVRNAMFDNPTGETFRERHDARVRLSFDAADAILALVEQSSSKGQKRGESVDPMTNDMVERVARAICESRYGSRCDCGVDGERQFPGCLKDARAAIAAMREPTRAMDGAGYDVADVPWKEDRGAELHLKIWKAMVDAALRPPAEPQ